MAMIVDEGVGMIELWNQVRLGYGIGNHHLTFLETYAQAAVGEKGYLDVEIMVETPGGHSSIPPERNGIGYMAQIIAAMDDRPPVPFLDPSSPLVTYLACAAEFSPDMPGQLREASKTVARAKYSGQVDQQALETMQDWYIEGSWKDGSLVKGLGRALISTTQAIDIVSGGFKVNALVGQFWTTFVGV